MLLYALPTLLPQTWLFCVLSPCPQTFLLHVYPCCTLICSKLLVCSDTCSVLSPQTFILCSLGLFSPPPPHGYVLPALLSLTDSFRHFLFPQTLLCSDFVSCLISWPPSHLYAFGFPPNSGAYSMFSCPPSLKGLNSQVLPPLPQCE